ncbi:MAG: DUF4340 domain-containing protein [Phycisphaerales bacterium]|nr:DUF4340 domain-containing protein [Phycisphaerales bacterium]
MKVGTLVMLVVAAGVVVSGAVLVVRSGAAPAPTPRTVLLFPDLKARAAGITALRVRGAEKSTVIRRAGSAWAVESKANYPADARLVSDALRSVLDATVIETKTSKPDLYSRLGVEGPDSPGSTSVLITFEDAAGVAASLIVGKRQWGGGADATAATTFVRREGEETSLHVKAELRADADPLSWIDRSVVDLRPERVRSATIVHGIPNGIVPPVAFAVSREKSEAGEFTLDPMPSGRSLKDQFVLTRVANALSGVTLDDVAPAAGVDFESPERVTVTYRCFDGLVIEGRLVTRDGNAWARFSASYSPAEGQPEAPPEVLGTEIARVNTALAGWAFQLPEWKAASLRLKPEDLLAPEATAPGPAEAPPPPGG